MNKKYNLKLDLQFRYNNSTMKFNQFDNNTSDFFMKISNGGKSFNIEKAIVVLAVIKPSGKVASQFVEVKNDIIYADLKDSMKDEIGTYTAKAMLILEDERVVTDPISYEVEEDKIFSLLNDTVEATEEFTLLTDMLNRLSTIEINEANRENNFSKIQEEFETIKNNHNELVTTQTDKKVIELLDPVIERVDNKINQVDNKISEVNEFVEAKEIEINKNLDENTKKINDKIIDIDYKTLVNTNKVDVAISKIPPKSELIGPQGPQGVKGDTPSITHLETTVSNKVDEIETRFNALTSSQQQDAEVIDARDGEVSLGARLNKIDLKVSSSTKPTSKFKTFNEVMESETLEVGDIAETLGFYTLGDGGSATYIVKDLVDNKSLSFKLNNGLYAEYIIENNVIHVDSLGAKKGSIENGLFNKELFNNITEYIRDVLGYGTIKFGNGLYYIDAKCNAWFTSRPGMSIYDNTTVEFSKGTVLQAIPNDSGFSSCIWMHTVNNVKILGNGGKIIGERNEHTDTGNQAGQYSNEHGHCVGGFNINNFTIQDIELRDAWGDGLFISRKNTNFEGNKDIDPNDTGNNITIKNVICDNNRRQGFSLIHGKNVVIENCEFKNTNGINPQCGIDLEANTDADVINNIFIKNCTFKNNMGSGIGTYIAERIKNITVENCVFDDNSKAISVICENNGNTLASEYWTVRNCIFTGNFKDNQSIAIWGNQLRYSIFDNNSFQDCKISISALRDSKIINNIFNTSTSTNVSNFITCGLWRCNISKNTFNSVDYKVCVGVNSGSFYSNYSDNQFQNISNPFLITQSRRNVFAKNTILNCEYPFRLGNAQASYNKFADNYMETIGIGLESACIVYIGYSSSVDKLESLIVNDNMVVQSGCLATDVGNKISDAPSYDKCFVLKGVGTLKNAMVKDNTISTYVSPSDTSPVFEILGVFDESLSNNVGCGNIITGTQNNNNDNNIPSIKHEDLLLYSYSDIVNEKNNSKTVVNTTCELLDGNLYTLVLEVKEINGDINGLYIQTSDSYILLVYKNLKVGRNIINFTQSKYNSNFVSIGLRDSDANADMSISYDIHGLYLGKLADNEIPIKDITKLPPSMLLPLD